MEFGMVNGHITELPKKLLTDPFRKIQPEDEECMQLSIFQTGALDGEAVIEKGYNAEGI